MEGDYLILSQFSYNSYPSPLGTIGFLISGIKIVNPKAMVETKSIILLDEAISNFQEIQKKFNIILQKLTDAKKKKKKKKDNNPKHLGPMRIIYQGML